MSESDPLQKYNWEEDDGWQVLWNKLDMDTLNNKTPEQRENWIRKRKAKWYKQNVDPEYVPPKVEPKSTSSKPSSYVPPSSYAPPRESTENNDSKEQKQSQSRQQRSTTSWSPTWSWYFYLFCHCWCIFAVPFVVITPARAYRSIITASAMCYGYFLKSRHGMPRFSQDYAQLLFTDENTFHFVYPVMCFIMKPGLIWLSPLLLRSLPLANTQLKKLMFTKMHWMYVRCKPIFKYIDQRKVNFNSSSGLLEVWIAIMMIPGALVFKFNSFIQAMIFWQYMRMKYMMNESCKYSFRKVNADIRGRLPASILVYYDKLAGYLHGMGDMRSQANTGRRCNIM